MRRGGPLVLLALSGALLLGACQPPGGAADAPGGRPAARGNDLDAAPSKTAPSAVQVVTARSGDLATKRRVSGTILASRDSDVAAQTGGTVARVNAREGDAVRAGQVVVQLDTTSLAQSVESARLSLENARINLAQARRSTALSTTQLTQAARAAESNLAKARATHESNRQVFALGGLPRSDLQASAASLAQAEADLAAARNNAAQNGQSGSGSLALLQNAVASAENQLAQARDSLRKASVRAPFSGTLGSLTVQAGEFVQQGATAFRLVDPSSLEAEFRVSPSDAANLPENTAVTVTYQGAALVGRVKVGNRVAASDRLVLLKAKLSGTDVPVGAVAQVSFNTTLGGGVLLPTGALVTDGDTTSAFVVRDGQAQKVAVTVLAESGGRVALRGVAAGDTVVNPIPSGLQDGARVSTTSAAGASAGGDAP